MQDEEPHSFDWDDKKAGLNLILYELTGDSKYQNKVEQFIDYLFNGARYTPKGLIYIDTWGSLRHAANVAHYCLQV